MNRDIPHRTLGQTGERVSVIGLGGAHIGRQAEESESIHIIRSAIDSGVTFMDNCWSYHAGASEIRMGKALQDGYRRRVFLMTKVDGRNKATAAKQIDESLRRLNTDGVDLLQFHEVIRMSDPERIFGPDGAMEAMLEAKKAGKTRFVGFTGHKSPEIHLGMLKTASEHGFRFDAVQMPLNAMDAHYDSFEKRVLPVLVEQGIGVLGMKPMGGGILLESGVVTAAECLRYAMSLPVSVVITGCDSLAVLEQALHAARDIGPLGEEERWDLLKRVAGAADSGRYEKYKTETRFDGTTQHPEWMG